MRRRNEQFTVIKTTQNSKRNNKTSISSKNSMGTGGRSRSRSRSKSRARARSRRGI